MKKSILIPLFGLLFLQTKGQTHDVTFNMAAMIAQNYSLGYFYNFRDDIGVGGTVGFLNSDFPDFDDLNWRGIYIAPEIRFYTWPDYDNDGFYWGAYMKYKSYESNSENTYYYFDNLGNDYEIKYTTNFNALSLGMVTGFQYYNRSGLLVNFFIGLGGNVISNFSPNDSRVPDEDIYIDTTILERIDFRLGISLGWRFGNSRAKKSNEKGKNIPAPF